MLHTMIDLETTALTPNAGIVSIGAVVFDLESYKVTRNTFYVELDWKNQNREIDDGTLEWWQWQPLEIQRALKNDKGTELKTGLKSFSSFLINTTKEPIVWGNGSIFDIAILENAYRQVGLPAPWKFHNVYDCRTIKMLYEMMFRASGVPNSGATHHALEDAIFQAEYICKMVARIKKSVTALSLLS